MVCFFFSYYLILIIGFFNFILIDDFQNILELKEIKYTHNYTHLNITSYN